MYLAALLEFAAAGINFADGGWHIAAAVGFTIIGIFFFYLGFRAH